MTQSLDKNLRGALEKAVKAARTVAETAANAAVNQLGVGHDKPEAFLSDTEKALRNRLRTHGKQLGDARDSKSTNPTYGKQEVQHLVQEVAYQHWHRMLFARFLADNNLLMYDGVDVTIEECDELAPDEGAKSGWELAGKLAARMLPQIFRPDSPVYELGLPQEHQHKLEMLVANLPQAIFVASDSLGWVYQFWQANNKDQINKSGVKIGADELPSVTQLFTEDYMVDFLLDNTLGAWHAGKALAANPELAETAQSEDDLRQAVALPGCPWKYLRFIQAKNGPWTPAAGTFDGWPKTAKELKCLDPCMGSGHFVAAMFERLVALRLAEEELDEAAAVAAVIRDNLFGLEIDPRCTQIGAFNLALAAWRRVGHCKLPGMNLACSGLAPNTREADWLAIAGDNEKLRNGMERLYRLFENAPVLGSLINPCAAGGDLLEAGFHELQPLLEKALAQETKDDTAHEMAVTARGLAKAAEVLAGQFTLIATNFPYLKRANQVEELKTFATFLDEHSHAELATTFLVKTLGDLEMNGTLAVVTPQSLTYQRYYVRLRKRMLEENRLRFVAKLGPGAFETISGEIVQPILLIVDNREPEETHSLGYADFVREAHSSGKASALKDGGLTLLHQKTLLNSREHKISSAGASDLPDLAEYCECYQGICTGDIPRFGACFWEMPREENGWVLQHSTPENGAEASGCTQILFWQKGNGVLYDQIVERLGEAGVSSWIRGLEAWGSQGVAIAQMQSLRSGHYTGKCFDSNTAVIIPKNQENRAAIFEYCRSEEYRDAVLEIDQSIKISNKTLLKVPFDLAHWQMVASEKYPHGLPKPFSSDPTQWLFNGHPTGADQPLQVAVARLLGYQWPRQTGSSFPDCPALGPDGLEGHADKDDIVCIPPVGMESAASDRLLNLLAAAYGSAWKNDTLAQLLTAVDHAGKSLEAWLRDKFFIQHCKLFHNRPFVWHVWDGLRDGFAALVNYHKLDYKTLESLIYTYLGDWISRQKRDTDNGVDGAQEKLAAAEVLKKRLELILTGEAPYDIFVRWKPIEEQPIGWNPDLNDGVRMNIRPFLSVPEVGKRGAGVLRDKPNIKWEKDRGSNVPSAPWYELGLEYGGKVGDRINDHHLSLAEKRAARERAK